jgi:hypothetical protein
MRSPRRHASDIASGCSSSQVMAIGRSPTWLTQHIEQLAQLGSHLGMSPRQIDGGLQCHLLVERLIGQGGDEHVEQSSGPHRRLGGRVIGLLRDSPAEFEALPDSAAERLGVDRGAVEKDYWATESTRARLGRTSRRHRRDRRGAGERKLL